MKKPVVPKRRCAVYTRKSTEEGLDQEFNSLDAQREACEAFVASQKAEGWVLVPDRYDDGGVSGATLERPALKRLLADIAAGRVDVVVVYKIDRLSRALMDFAKLVEVFDRHAVTFVSVTQAFNTTTSMGRLTLNILLSFAQFEREVIGERIRDKFAASRRKGMWMGGHPPLGYDVQDRKLVVNKAEAATVRMIFERFVRVSDPSEDVFLLVDESHRGQYGRLHSRMRKIFPNACYLGFTGTPILKTEKNTAAKFGGIIDVYAIDQAVKDKAVVPLLYEGRHVEQRVDEIAIDAWFERVCAGLSEDQKADLKRKYARTARLFQTEQTIALIAFDVSEHFRRTWKGTGFKGQLVTPSKRSAILYKRALDELGVVTSEVIISAPGDREGEERIDEASSDEVKRFWKTAMDRYGDEATYNSRIIEAFKKREDPEILIVVSKLLTGFDAPRNTILYLARPLTEHNLLQAIARVNRVAEGKDYGYIVDYCSVLGELNQALSSYSALEGFDEADLAGTVTSINTEIEKLGQRHSELWDVFRGVANTADEEALEQHLADEARRDEFYDRLNAFSRTLAIALSSHEFANEPSNQRRIAGYRDDLRRFENLRRAVRTRYQDAVDYGQYRKRIEKLLDTYVVADDIRPITDLVNIFDEDAFAEVLNSNESAASRADTIAHATKRTIDERWEEDPTYYKRFSELIRQAIEDFRAKSISDLEYLKRVREIRDQMVRRDTTDIPEPVRDDPLGRAFYGCIREALSDVQGSGEADTETLSAEAAAHLVDIINSHRRVDWAQDPDVENAMKNDIDDYIFDVIRGEHNVPISPEAIDVLIDRLLMVARRQAA